MAEAAKRTKEEEKWLAEADKWLAEAEEKGIPLVELSPDSELTRDVRRMNFAYKSLKLEDDLAAQMRLDQLIKRLRKEQELREQQERERQELERKANGKKWLRFGSFVLHFHIFLFRVNINH